MSANQVPWWRPSVGEMEGERIFESVREGYVGPGPVTELFEAELAVALNVPFAVATTSGSTALLMAYMACGIGRGDEVIIANRTFIATAHAAMLLGAKVVLVDCQSDLPLIDISNIQSKITRKTKAIVPVHLNGRSADMEQINTLAKAHGLYVIEDAAQAMFSRHSSGYLGTNSHAGCFSLGITKLITTGQGGVVVTQDRDMCERLKLIRNHGVITHLSESFDRMGFNFKFNDVLAALGRVQLGLVREHIQRVNDIYTAYEVVVREIPSMGIIPVRVEWGEVPLYAEVLCENRSEAIEFLAEHGVETRKAVPDLHLSPHLKQKGTFPNSSKFGERGIILPSGPGQYPKNIDHVVSVLRMYANKAGVKST